MQLLHRSPERVLSKGIGRWILWDARTRLQLASGRYTPATLASPDRVNTFSDLAGTTIMVPLSGSEFELRRLHDAHPTSTIRMHGAQRQNGLASDGSFAYSVDTAALHVFDLDGKVRLRRPGNYYEASVYADRDALYVANGPTHTPTVETVRLDGTSTFSRRFFGAFEGWFTDGGHFLARTESELFVYDREAERRHVMTFGADGWLRSAGGHGAYFWIQLADRVSVYRIGQPEPVLGFVADGNPEARRDGTVAWMIDRQDQLLRLDLAESEPSLSTHALPARFEPSTYGYGGSANGAWVVASNEGVIHTGASRAASATLGCGKVLSLAGSPSGRFAIGTGDGRVRIYDPAPAGPKLARTLATPNGALALSDDGHVLFALGPQRYESPDRTLRVFRLPEGTLLHAWPVPIDEPAQQHVFAISADGQRVARMVCSGESDPAERCQVSVSNRDGNALVRIETIEPALMAPSVHLFLSPNGKQLALSDDLPPRRTAVYDDAGKLLASFALGTHGFVGDDRLLATIDEGPDDGPSFMRAAVVDLRGALVTSPHRAPLLGYGVIRPVGRDRFYDTQSQRVYRIADGTVAWDPAATIPDFAPPGLGDVAGDRLVLVSGGIVYAPSFVAPTP